MPASRVTIPAEFFDITSAGMLVQPQPSFVFAQMAFAANARAELAALDAGSMLIGGRMPLPSQGASVPSLQSNQLSLGALPISESIAVVPELGQKGAGHTIRINRPVFSGGGYTEAARIVGSQQTISVTPIEVGMEQVSLTVKRYAGPFASNGTSVQPYSIDRFDAGRSVHSLVQTIGLNLQQDRMRWLDGVFSALFNSAATNIVRAGLATADSQFPTTGEAPMDLELLFRAEEVLSAANIPRFSDGRYQAILSPRQLRQLRLDPDFANQAKEETQYNTVAGSAAWINIGPGIRVAQSSTIQTDTATIAGQTIQRGVMFGPGAIGYGIDEACRVSAASDDNYGETAKVIWLAYEGMGLLDERFLCSLRSI